MLETAVLGLLVESDLHGYELKKRLTDLFGPWSSVSFGSLYPALTRLEQRGFVRSVDQVTAAPMSGSLGAEVAAFRARARSTSPNRRGRKVYAMTDSGRTRLTEILDDTSGDDRAFAVRVAFCRHLSREKRVALFQRRTDEIGRRLDARPGTPSGTPSGTASGTPSGTPDRYRTSLADYQHDRLVRERDWLAALLAAELADKQLGDPAPGPTDDHPPLPISGGTPT